MRKREAALSFCGSKTVNLPADELL